MALICFFISYIEIDSLIVILLLIPSILLLFFTKSKYVLLLIPVCYTMDCVIVYLSTFLCMKITGMKYSEINNNPISLMATAIMTIIISTPILLIAKMVINKKRISDNVSTLSKSVLYLISFIIFMCAFIVFIIASLFDNIELPTHDFMLLIVLLSLFFIITIAISAVVIFTMKKSYNYKQEIQYWENLNEYTKNLETVYNNLRSFKHDYVNIMTAMAGYFEEEQYEQLKDFFYKHILPTKNNLNQDGETLNKLLHIKILEIKSILYTKMVLAINKNISITLDIPDDIDTINMNSIDLTRVLGIYLDNAIEASLETAHPELNVHICKMEHSVVFIISNSFVNNNINISDINKIGVTTKGEGHGIGLHNANEILNKYGNILKSTRIEENMFIQELQVS